MKYEEAIEYINGFSDSKGSENNPESFSGLMCMLGETCKNFNTVHVVGENGKESICEYISGALRAGGKNVGKFTPSYIECIEECIQINGKNISKEAFAILSGEVKKAVEDCAKMNISSFEILSAVCFLYFSREQVDIAVIGNGNDGLFDCTSVVLPKVRVIASDDADQVAESVHRIIEPHVPCVISSQNSDTIRILKEQCAGISYELIIPEKSRINIIEMDDEDAFFSYKGASYHISASGDDRIRNAISAIEACRVLGVSYGNIFTGLEKSVMIKNTD